MDRELVCERLRCLDEMAFSCEGVKKLTPEILQAWLSERRMMARNLATAKFLTDVRCAPNLKAFEG